MYVFITDNLLKVNRILPGAIFLCSDVDLPAIKIDKHDAKDKISKLYAAQIGFIVDICQKGDVLPDYVPLQRRSDCQTWYEPDYTVKQPVQYYIEFLDGNGTYQYRIVPETQIENMMLCCLNITAVMCSEGGCPRKTFRDKYGFSRVRAGGLVFCVPTILCSYADCK